MNRTSAHAEDSKHRSNLSDQDTPVADSKHRSNLSDQDKPVADSNVTGIGDARSMNNMPAITQKKLQSESSKRSSYLNEIQEKQRIAEEKRKKHEEHIARLAKEAEEEARKLKEKRWFDSALNK